MRPLPPPSRRCTTALKEGESIVQPLEASRAFSADGVAWSTWAKKRVKLPEMLLKIRRI